MTSGENGPGDTQPISQSIYENIIAREKSFQPSQNGGYPRSDAHDADQESLPMTVKEGEPGHIDLLAGFDSKKATVAHNSSDDDELSSKGGPSSPMPLASHEVFPESQRFLETPVTSEKQRDTPNLAITTPSLPRNPLAADLGSSGGTMALSLGELFKATQAPSSPFVNGLPSAPLSDRPSPDIPIQTRPLGAYTSSPSRTPRPHFTRTYTDPLSYVSMEESQKLRDKLSEERRTRSAENIDSEEHIDTDFEEESSFVQRMNRQRKIANETDIRLASVTGGRSPSGLKAKLSVGPINHQSRDGLSGSGYDEQRPSTPLNNEGVSEEETEKEDNVEIQASQTRQVVSSSEEDKENHVGPYTAVPYTSTLAHDRLSQALELHNESTLTDTPPAELSLLTPQANIVKMPEQVINVRDSQPSPSQRSSTHARTTSLLSHPESEQIHSSYDDLSPPRKRQRQDYTAQLSPNKQLSSSARSPNHSSRHQPSSKYQIQDTSRTSSLPSLVANTPVIKIGEDTIPETSIPESSPGRIRQATATLDAPSRLSTMQETDEEDPELPTPRHQRQWRNFAGISSQNGTQSRKWSSFVSSSPAKGTIKTLSEISAELSPHVAPDDESWDVQIFSNEDREFSKTIESPSHIPRKKFRTAGDQVNPQVVSSLLAPPESSRSVNAAYAAQSEPQANDPESPGSSIGPVIARRQRGRPIQTKEDMFDMDASPRARTPVTTSHMLRTSQLNRPEEKAPQLPSPTISKIPHNSSQRSFAPINTNSNQVEQMVQDSLATSNRNLLNTNTQEENATSDIESPVPEDAMIAPNQVLAFWNGRKRAYFPATYLRSCGPKRCLVNFVDSREPVEVALGSVKKLQLRVGDAIKVDLLNVPKVTHIVRGFSQQLKPEDLLRMDDDGHPPVTDIYGFSNVILAAKQRKSLPGGGHLEREETIQVPIRSIYLDMILWNQLKGRPFTPDKKMEPGSNVIQTPGRGASTPVSPGSKLSRTHLTIREGIFSGMVFAVSFGDQDVTKARLTRLIFENGGQILQDGFEELFEFPSNVPPVTQTATSSQTSSTEEAIHFRLAPKYENTGFACLIADKHSRRAKYMQALALNVPCLSRRWVEDCASQNRILGWEHYLLPAGESKYLYGAIKSRVLTAFSAKMARFAEMIGGRAKLLDGQSVLLVLGRGKTEERRKAYLFLAYALGATKVGRVLDLKSGKKMLNEYARNNKGQRGWDWLYVDDHEEAAAKEMIMGKPSDIVGGSRKRKRSSIFTKSLVGDETARDEGSIQVMSNESVCQSLILGMICK
jgi:Fungal Rad9-like Rad53-binding/BRCA1 C Terminus (BRCT) domain